MSDEEENALAGDARMEWMEGRIANALRCKADAVRGGPAAGLSLVYVLQAGELSSVV